MHGKNNGKTFVVHFFGCRYHLNGTKACLDVALIIGKSASKDILKLETVLNKVLSYFSSKHVGKKSW